MEILAKCGLEVPASEAALVCKSGANYPVNWLFRPKTSWVHLQMLGAHQGDRADECPPARGHNLERASVSDPIGRRIPTLESQDAYIPIHTTACLESKALPHTCMLPQTSALASTSMQEPHWQQVDP